MKAQVLIFIFLLKSVTGLSQTYSVTYFIDKREFAPPSNPNVTIIGLRDMPAYNARLIFNDSLSYHYSYPESKDPYPTEEVYGTKPYGKCSYYNGNTNTRYITVKMTVGKKSEQGLYLVSDTLPTTKWITNNETKMILGYICHPALNVTEKNDSTLVWYTSEIPLPFGPGGYEGFPGLVLAIHDQQYGSVKTAIKVEKINSNVQLPGVIGTISQKQYSKFRNRMGY